MQDALASAVRRFLRTHDASYGFEYALLSCVIAGLLVLSASLYARETIGLIQELRCNLSPGCAVRIESAAQPPAAPATPAVPQTVAFPTQEPEIP